MPSVIWRQLLSLWTGGRDFLASLVTAVSAYAQEFLSKVPHPEAHKNDPGLVKLQKVDDARHRLIVNSGMRDQGLDVASSSQPPIEIDLTTVQLFDLVEAVISFLLTVKRYQICCCS